MLIPASCFLLFQLPRGRSGRQGVCPNIQVAGNEINHLLVGFFAGGEIAHASIYGYTGVLTVFLAEL